MSHVMSRRVRSCLITMVTVWCGAVGLHAQVSAQGAWLPGFDHGKPVEEGGVSFLGPKPAGDPRAVWPDRFEAVDMALIPKGPYRGAVMVFDYEPACAPGWTRFAIVDPLRKRSLVTARGSFDFLDAWLDIDSTAPELERNELFCAGHAWTAEGDLFVAGGTKAPLPQGFQYGAFESGPVDQAYFHGAKLAYLWDPSHGLFGTWTRLPDLAQARWYPSVVAVDAGHVAVLGGYEFGDFFACNTLEVYELASRRWARNVHHVPDLPTLLYGPPYGVDWPEFLHFYPRASLLSNGDLFFSGFHEQSVTLRVPLGPLDPCVWSNRDGRPPVGPSQRWRTYGTAFLAPLFGQTSDLVFRIGGSDAVNAVVTVSEKIEMCQVRPGAGSQWQVVGKLAQPRDTLNSVLLPDGKVLLVGGRANGQISPYDTEQIRLDANAPHTAELYDPSHPKDPPVLLSNALGAQDGPRVYHSTALLLPDASVLVAGGESRTVDYQRYLPPYLTNGKPRPRIASAPPTLGYDDGSGTQDFAIECSYATGSRSPRIQHVVLVRPGSVTHHADVDPRVVELPLFAATSAGIQVGLPQNANVVPPGYYMLFVLDDQGTPSEAAWVKVG